MGGAGGGGEGTEVLDVPSVASIDGHGINLVGPSCIPHEGAFAVLATVDNAPLARRRRRSNCDSAAPISLHSVLHYSKKKKFR